MIDLVFLAVIALVAIGLYAVMFKRNLIKIVVGINIIGSAVNLFIVSLGYRSESIAPIFTGTESLNMVLATPQALTLTSIVINLAVTALMQKPTHLYLFLLKPHTCRSAFRLY